MKYECIKIVKIQYKIWEMVCEKLYLCNGLHKIFI